MKTFIMARSHWPECHFVCFPNRNLGVRGANGSYSGSSRCVLGSYWLFGSVRMHTERHSVAQKNVLCMFKIISIDHPNVAFMCIREVFGKYYRSIQHVRKTSGKHASSSWCIRNENLEVLGSVCFFNTPNGPRTRRMLSERFQYPFLICFHLCRRMYKE